MLPPGMSVLLPFVAALLLSAAPPSPPPPAAPIAPELKALRESLARTRKVYAHFTQTRHWAALQDALVTHGSFQYQKGGRLVWRTDKPAESELVLEGQSAVIRFPALGTSQAIDFSEEPGMARVFDSISAVVQADLERLRPLFELTLERKAPLRVVLRPRSEELARTVQRIQLEFDAKHLLQRVRLDEAGGDHTEIEFSGHVVEAASP